MRIPKILEERIGAENHALRSFLDSALALFEPWVSKSQIPFFPEYTDHSIQHVEEVLHTAVGLATEEATKLLSSNDAITLIFGVCLHDSAMHLTEDGFFSLIAPDSQWKPVQEFDSTPWSNLWEDFIGESRRFDGRTLTAIFGSAEAVQRPPTDVDKLTRRDRLLIGEFIRRHHSRLAHEIALYGIPGPKGSAVVLFPESNNFAYWLADIAGVIARSHGMPLRKCAEYLRQKYDMREFKGIHAVFLMTLVRIADYLQIQEQRAPSELLLVRKLSSPTSQGEWKVHESVRNITAATEDPEAIFIDAHPKEVQTFLRLREWLTGIQSELDNSWAVLGEVFGRYQSQRLDRLGLVLRRVRSNIDNVVEFSKTVPYVPAKISFEAANPDLLKLLVTPLYGDDPGIGLRELIQNAVDAVRELEELLKQRNDLKSAVRRDQEADVVVEFDCDEDGIPSALSVSDRGIGMSLDVIQNYFLKAGASFRKSDAWRKQFEDEEGHSSVLRSGRFGVGALAAFLIGNRIEVTTRYIDDPADRGITFVGDLDEASISLKWAKCPVGTVVRVLIPKHNRESIRDAFLWRLRSSWPLEVDFGESAGQYFARYPEVRRYVIRKTPSEAKTETRVEIKLEASLPDEQSDMLPPWRNFRPKDYSNIFWTYDKRVPSLSCNGIIVEMQNNQRLHDYKFFEMPSLLVYDRDGRLPLNLQRTDLASTTVSFSDDLLKAQVDDLIAYALLTGPTRWPQSEEEFRWFGRRFNGFVHAFGSRLFQSDRWFITSNGFCLLDADLVQIAKPKAVVIAYTSKNASRPAILPTGTGRSISDRVFLFACDSLDINTTNDLKGLSRMLFEHRWNFHGFPEPLNRLNVNGRRAYVRKGFLSALDQSGPGKDLRWLLEQLKPETEFDDWVVIAVGDCPSDPVFDFKALLDHAQMSPAVQGFAECYVSEPQEERSDLSIVASRWIELLKEPVIPFDVSERQRKFANAYGVLEKYIELYKVEIAAKEKKRREDEGGE